MNTRHNTTIIDYPAVFARVSHALTRNADGSYDFTWDGVDWLFRPRDEYALITRVVNAVTLCGIREF